MPPTQLSAFKDIHDGRRVYVIGKGPSLQQFLPFDRLAGNICFGVNNVYKYFPHCRYVVLWHKEYYFSDASFLETQRAFQLFYSSFHSLPVDLPNAVDLQYAGDFPDERSEFGQLAHWRAHPGKMMFKTTFATAIKLAWWMGARHITLVGFDFSLANGRTANDDVLHIDVALKNYTVEQILDRQALVFENLRRELSQDGIVLDRAFSLEDVG